MATNSETSPPPPPPPVATTTIQPVVRPKPPPPLDRGWAWMIVLGVFINVFFMVGIAKSFGIFLLEFRRYFGVGNAEAALPISVSAFVYAIGAPTAILIADLITSQKVVICGAVIGLIGLACTSALYNMGYVIFFFGVCFGIGNSCYYGNGLVMIGKYFRKRRSLATGLGLAGASIGQFVMPPIIEYLLETYSLSGTFLIISACYFHGAIAGFLFRPIEQYGPEEKAAEAVRTSTNTGEDQKATSGESDTRAEPGDDEKLKTGNGDLPHPAPNGQVLKENGGHTYISFEDNDLNVKETTELMQEDGSSLPNGKRGSHRWSQVTDEDEKIYLERKALLASNGSIYLVSPSVLDISTIDKRAHGATLKEKKPHFLQRLFDFRVLRSYISIFFVIVSFLCFFGYFNFILFLPPIFVERAITKYDKALLISICGIGDLISRIGTGFIADLNFLPRYRLKAGACLLSGINILMFVFADSFAWLGVHCFLYGFLGGAYVCLLSVVLVDFVGVALMSKNLAIVLLLQGIGAAVGQIFLGWMADETNSYSPIIILCFLSMVVGSLLLFCYPLVRRLEDSRLAKLNKEKESAVVS